MFRKSCIFLICFFVYLNGHPLDNNEERTAFEYIDVANKDIGGLTEGDMAIPQEAVLRKGYKQWPNGIVPYTISSSFSSSEKQKIRDALNNIMRAATCLSFQEKSRSTAPTDYVEVIKSGGCWSMVGNIGGKQQLSLGNGCVYTGTIIHEFLHAIGFYHEQSRPDRDQYVRIITGNIQGGREHNFKKASNTDNLGVEYDPKSVMHYSNRAFSNGNGDTIQWKKDPSVRLGGRVLTDKDKQQLNLKYCNAPPPPPTTTKTTTKRTTRTKRPTTTKRTTTTKRPTRPTMTTKKPTTKACGDKSGYCIYVRSSSRCSSTYKLYCPRSCNVCTGSKSEMCMNLRDRNYYCRYRAERGECRVRDYSTRLRMKLNCPKVCCERGELYR